MKKTIAIAVSGNVLEWFDFSIYAAFAPIIASQFFPQTDPRVSMLYTFSALAMGYLIRPLSSIFFGHLADTQGRKKALLLSVALISVPTLLIAFLPGFATIGILAPITLILCRITQGISIGGEYTTSMLYLVENAHKDQRGFIGSWVFFGGGIGMTLGSLTSLATAYFLSPQDLYDWGWRLPFVMGMFTGFFALFMRYGAQETLDFQKNNKAITSYPMLVALREYKKEIGLVMGISIFSNISAYVIYVYLPSYFQTILGKSPTESLLYAVYSISCFVLLVPFMGWLSDKIGRKTCFLTSCMGMILLAYPCFYTFQQGSWLAICLVLFSLSLCIALFQGGFSAMLAELFPTTVRASGMGFGYNLVSSILGGTCPLICAYGIFQSQDVLFPAYYLMLASVISGFIVFFIPTYSLLYPSGIK